MKGFLVSVWLAGSCVLVGGCDSAGPARAEPPSMRAAYDAAPHASFQIPADWAEEKEAEDSTMFYSREPGSGTLRFTTLTRPLNDKDRKRPFEHIQSEAKEYGVSVETLPAGARMIRYAEQTSEDGVP